jgi:hypothetical protein
VERTVVGVLDHEVAGVDIAQAATVGDGDVGEAGQGGAEAMIKGELGILVYGGGGLVEEEPGGAMKEDAGEGEALLFAAGEDMGPVRVLFEARSERSELAEGERVLADGVGKMRRLPRVSERGAE